MDTRLAVLAIFLLLTFANGQNRYSSRRSGDSCNLNKHRRGTPVTGICLSVEKCTAVQHRVWNGDKDYVSCGFERRAGRKLDDEVVCCPLSSERADAACDYHVRHRVHTLILGGQDAGHGEFPHMAALGIVDDKFKMDWFCGGTIISKRFILTAAHCLWHKPTSKLRVKVGGWDLHSETQDGTIYGVERVILHPRYKPPSAYNDISLIRTVSDLKFGQFVHPACLHTKKKGPKDMEISGWGLQDITDITFDVNEPRILQKGLVSKVRGEDCKTAYEHNSISMRTATSMPHGVISTIICAIDKKHEVGSKMDTCQGDSGGPLQYKGQHLQFYVVGVTSGGSVCGDKFPSTYTKVSMYVDWITFHVWPHETRFK